ncbi:cellulose biosynthesis protein BcsO, partial [Klebsiella michiganensis]
MNHYDDLQRFKEKTRTHSLKFKDLSSEAAAGEKGDWVILNQLIPAEEASSLAMGGSVSLPLPQRVPADMFHKVEPAAVQAPPAPSLAAPSLIIPPSAPQPAPLTDIAAAAAVEPALPQSLA